MRFTKMAGGSMAALPAPSMTLTEIRAAARKAIRERQTRVTLEDVNEAGIGRAGWLLRSLPSILPRGARPPAHLMTRAHFDEKKRDWVVRFY